MDPRLQPALSSGLIRPLDAHFAGFIGELAGSADEALIAAACLVSQQLGEGHICVDLDDHAGGPLFADPSGAGGGLDTPPLGDWIAALRRSGVVQTPERPAPLVLDGTRLYLRRYWCLEQRLAGRLAALAATQPEVDDALLRDGLQRLFGPLQPDIDWQRVAAAVAVLRAVAIISGGPGTGKTRTVSRVLALLVEQALARGQTPRIRLAAPTGKAAARLTEAIEQSLPDPAALRAPEVLAAIPREAVTLHRLLGARPDRVQFRHNAANPLHLDVLLVDEASMVDLPLMARLVDALPAHARLILLGDRDQLASVEAGAVLGDLCDGAEGFSAALCERLQATAGHELTPGEPVNPLADGTAFLHKSWRFADAGDATPGIGSLARVIRNGDGDALRRMLDAVALAGDEGATGAIGYRRLSGNRPWQQSLVTLALPYYRALAECEDAAQALAALNGLRILCALRDGPFGVKTVNRALREMLGEPASGARWYHGLPIMVTTNDYRLGLFNGDTGVLWAGDDGLRACFPHPEHGVRDFAPQRLPSHEAVYAMTVHKSQGSEFDRVLMITPVEPSPVLTRELIYTGATRARRQVEIWGDSGVLADAVTHRPTRRASGLQTALREQS